MHNFDSKMIIIESRIVNFEPKMIIFDFEISDLEI